MTWDLDVLAALTSGLGTEHVGWMSDPIRLSPSGAGTRGASQLAAAHKCERQFLLRYNKGLEVLHEPEHRLMGTLIHTRLAYHYAARMDSPPAWASRPVEEALIHDGGGGRPDLMALSQRIYQMYADRWAADPWTPLFVEHEFSAALKEIDPGGVEEEEGEDDIVITAKLDLYVRSNGRNWIVDHKTKRLLWNSTRLPDWNPLEFQLSWQCLLYTHIVRAHCKREGMEQPAGFMIQRLSRELPFDCDRNVVMLPQMAYQEAPQSARLLVRNELRLRKKIKLQEKLVPNYSVCQSGFGCDFTRLCAAGPKARPGVLTSFYKRR